MDLGLRDRVYVVTGGSRGIGLATALVLVEEGARAVLVARDTVAIDAAVTGLGRSSAVGLAADLQLASAFANTDFVEYLTGSPYIDAIVAEPWQLDAEGMLAIPTAPGLGIDLNFDALKQYRSGEKFLWQLGELLGRVKVTCADAGAKSDQVKFTLEQ